MSPSLLVSASVPDFGPVRLDGDVPELGDVEVPVLPLSMYEQAVV
jgi:hypothetical protein